MRMNLVQQTWLQIRMSDLGKKDRCCNCHHPLSECPYFEDNGEGMTAQEKSRICDGFSGVGYEGI